ncbi:MAG: GLPGLI family protein [Nonlabens sp.]
MFKRFFNADHGLNLLLTFFTLSFATSQSTNIGYVTYETYSKQRGIQRGPFERELYFNATESLEVILKEDNVYKESISTPLSERKGWSRTDSLGQRLYRNIKTKEFITRRPPSRISDAFRVEERWIEIDWNIHRDKTKQLEGLKCILATGTFRGRDYHAWFTPDIPYPFGPWKLHGLPGLIVEAYDDTNTFRFVLFDYDYPTSVDDKIIERPSSAPLITHKQEVYLSDNFGRLAAEKMNEALIKKGLQARITSTDQPQRSADAWELIYEWER